MEKNEDKLIQDALLKSAYDQRHDDWLNDIEILSDTDVSDDFGIEHHLLILCDRKFLSKRKISKEDFEYRITALGVEYVEAGFQKPFKEDFTGYITVKDSTNTSVMIGSPYGQQFNSISNTQLNTLINKLKYQVDHIEDINLKAESKDIVNALDEECKKHSPNKTLISLFLKGLEKTPQIISTIIAIKQLLGLN